MTKREPKDKLKIPTRTARPKGDMFQNLRRPEEVESLRFEELVERPAKDPDPRPSRPSTPSRGSSPIAPMRDFSKVANSIVRDVVPTGEFTGKSKQLYDYLYSLTRGAIQPRRSVCLTKVKLMVGAGIGSEVTLRANLTKLKSMGLVDENVIPGTHGGNEYTVYLPEEARPSTPSRPSSTGQILDPVEAVESTPSRVTLSATESINSGDSKISFKTKDQNTDDEAFAGLYELFRQTVINLTGKAPSAAEQDRWRELAELLVTELQIAAARTGQVSNVPAFLTEHLRRRLWKKDKAQLEKEEQSAPEPKQGIDASKCPDCGGSGWWYPDGVERGVAKCKHQALHAK